MHCWNHLMGFLGDLHVYYTIFLYTGKQWNEIHEYAPHPTIVEI